MAYKSLFTNQVAGVEPASTVKKAGYQSLFVVSEAKKRAEAEHQAEIDRIMEETKKPGVALEGVKAAEALAEAEIQRKKSILEVTPQEAVKTAEALKPVIEEAAKGAAKSIYETGKRLHTEEIKDPGSIKIKIGQEIGKFLARNTMSGSGFGEFFGVPKEETWQEYGSKALEKVTNPQTSKDATTEDKLNAAFFAIDIGTLGAAGLFLGSIKNVSKELRVAMKGVKDKAILEALEEAAQKGGKLEDIVKLRNELESIAKGAKGGEMQKITKPVAKTVQGVNDPPLQEAKGKTLKEFVKGQGKPQMHFTSDNNANKITANGLRETSVSKPISITSSETTAWDLKNKTRVDIYISPEAKIMNYTDLPKDMRLRLGKDYVKALEGRGKSESAINKELGDYVVSQGYQGIKYNARHSKLDELPDFQDLLDPYETRVYDSSILKTKSQLTDIWNEANKVKAVDKQAVSTTKPAVKYVSPLRKPTKTPMGIKSRIMEAVQPVSPRVDVTARQALRSGIMSFRRGVMFERKALRTELVAQFKEKTTALEDLRNQVVNYAVAFLPNADRGRFIKHAANVKTKGELASSLRLIENQVTRNERIRVVDQLQKLVDNIENLPVDDQARAFALVSNINFENFMPETIKKLRKLEMAITRDPNIMKRLPEELQKKLALIDKRRLQDIKPEELNSISRSLQEIFTSGTTKKKISSNITTLKKELALKELQLSSVNPDRIPPADGNIVGHVAASFAELYRRGDWATTFMDRFFDMLDGFSGYEGANYKIFKESIDIKFSDYKAGYNGMVDAFVSINEGLKLTTENFERIGIHAIRAQKNGNLKLLNSGFKQSQIDAVKLSEAEMGMYQFMRRTLDSMRTPIQDVMKKYNRKLDIVDNYFPYVTDFENPRNVDLVDLIEDSFRRSSTPQGFTKQRLPNGQQAVKIDAREIYLKHMDRANYFINMEETIRSLSSIAKDPIYAKTVGEKAQKHVLDWVDTLARQGGYKFTDDWQKSLDFLNRNVGIGVLAFKITSAVKQPIAIMNGAAEIGTHAFTGLRDVVQKKEIRDFVMRASQELKSRFIGDVGFLELAENRQLRTLQEKGLWALKRLDTITASGVWWGAYRLKMQEMGKIVDLKAVNQTAQLYADRVVRLTQSSGEIKDLPAALAGRDRFWGRMLFKFQSFMLNQWNYIGKDAIKQFRVSGDKRKAVQQLSWLLVAAFAESTVDDIAGALFNKKDPDEKSMGESLAYMLMEKVPVLGNFVSAMQYDSNPVPLINVYEVGQKGLSSLLTGKTPETKMRGFIRAFEAAGELGGIPGSAQGSQFLRMFLQKEASTPQRAGSRAGRSSSRSR